MASNNPPDGWEMATGAWTTDANRDESIAVIGTDCVNLKSTAVATELIGPWVSTLPSQYHYLSAWMRADSIAAGRILNLELELYDSSRTYISNTSVHTAVLSAANTWEFHGGRVAGHANARWMRIRFYKAAQFFNAYFDGIALERVQPSWGLQRDANQSINNASWTTVAFDAQMQDDSSGTMPETRCSNSSGVITIEVPGSYMLDTAVEFVDAPADGTLVDVRFKIGNLTTRYRRGTAMVIGAATQPRVVGFVANEYIGAGETVEVEVYHNHGSARNIGGSSATVGATYFTGMRNGRI